MGSASGFSAGGVSSILVATDEARDDGCVVAAAWRGRSFAADPREVDAGQPTKLSWVTRGATQVEIFDDEGRSIPLGSEAVDQVRWRWFRRAAPRIGWWRRVQGSRRSGRRR